MQFQPDEWLLATTIALIAGTITAAIIGLCLKRAWLFADDHPNHRSMHVKTTPRGGGLAILIAAAVCWTFWGTPALAVWIGVGALAAVSFWDDHRGAGVLLRLGVQTVAATLFVATQIPGESVWLLPIIALTVLWACNMYNFMDGADGMAGMMTTIGFATICCGAAMKGQWGLALAAAPLAGGALGFLCFNFPPAKIFLGDVGAIPLGFLAATLGITGWTQGVWQWYFPLLAFAPFVADATLTVMIRAGRGDRIWLAHKEHFYQKLIRSGLDHRSTLGIYVLLMITSSLSALASQSASSESAALIGGAWIAFFALFFLGIQRRFAKRASVPGV